MTVTEDVSAVAVAGLRESNGGDGRTVQAVRGLTFTVGAGELTCLVGPSGCGTTTLLECVTGLLPPTSGDVRVDGAAVDLPDERDQLSTRSAPRFAELRTHVYEQIQRDYEQIQRDTSASLP